MKHKTLYDERFSILGIFRWRLFHSLAPQLLLGASPILAQLLENVLPIRIGSDQTGNSKFTGEIASVRFYSRTLLSNEVARLYQAGPEASLMPAIFAWHSGEAETLTNGLGQGSGDWSVEAWIHPVPGETGRIVDKITPGGADGFMLDTYPGKAIRLICGEAQMSVPVTFTGQWVHVVAAMENSGALSLFVNGVRHGEDGTPDGLLYRGSVAPPESPLTAWYLRPAARWTEALPIGNGRLGGMVWGGVTGDRIDLNEDTLWSGEPYDNLNPKGLAALPEIRRLLMAGKNAEAQQLVELDMNGRYNQSYQPLGDLQIDFPLTGEVSAYRRELDLQTAVTRTEFIHNDVRYTREVFASFPAQAIIVRLSADQPGCVSFKASLGCQLHHTTKVGHGFLQLTGRCQAHTDPSYAGSGEQWEDLPDGRGMRFETRLVPVGEGGHLAISDDGILADGCDSVTMLLVAATSFNGPWKSPSREGKDPGKLCDAYLASLAGKSFATLRAEHVADYQRLFNRVALDLGHTDAEKLPTNVRLKRFTPAGDPSLSEMYYQFGRYLLISCSRPGAQPANLQGLWNHETHPPWSANWTLNCNAEINYWPVEPANLLECDLPLIKMTQELRVDGAHIAEKLYGAKGWLAHHNTDIWRQAGPVSGSATWSIFQVGGAWLCQQVWEHYAFTQDKKYLREVWPVLRGSAEYFLTGGLMEEPKHHWLVTGPDTNFENPFRKPDGSSVAACMGPTGNMQMIRQLFLNCVAASKILDTDPDFRAEVEKALPRLPPMEVSPTDGELQEWPEDWKRTAECQVLSSWGLICADQINRRRTPELAAALRKIWDTENHWAHGSVGSWQGAFPAMVYARLGAGDNVATILSEQLRGLVNPNLTASFGGMSEWQIDGNLGLTSAIGETLLQSQAGEIELLPALPEAWAAGKVSGLRARGGFTVDIEWKDHKVVSYRIASAEPREVKIHVNGEVKTVQSEKQ
jgi:alpha-L-fucosidase 2